MNKLNFKYILPEKIPTHLLENRSGNYRQLASSQHHISIRQMFETETKFHLQSFCQKKISHLFTEKSQFNDLRSSENFILS